MSQAGIILKINELHMHGSRKFCQRGSKFDKVFCFVFLVDEGIEDQNVTIIGPSLTRQQNTI